MRRARAGAGATDRSRDVFPRWGVVHIGRPRVALVVALDGFANVPVELALGRLLRAVLAGDGAVLAPVRGVGLLRDLHPCGSAWRRATIQAHTGNHLSESLMCVCAKHARACKHMYRRTPC